jgi:exosome complex protein LRP1
MMFIFYTDIYTEPTMENTDLIKQFIASLDASVDTLAPDVKQLISKSFEDRCNETEGLEQVQLSNGYAYIFVSLCFAYLKSTGVNTNDHPIMKDLDRVKSYMKRQKLVESGQTEEAKADTSVARRFIQGVLGAQREPAISQEHFKPAHIKFEQDGKKKDDDDEESIRNKVTKKLKEKKGKREKNNKKGKVTK